MTKFDQLFVSDDYILYGFKKHLPIVLFSPNEYVDARKFVCVAT